MLQVQVCMYAHGDVLNTEVIYSNFVEIVSHFLSGKFLRFIYESTANTVMYGIVSGFTLKS